MTLIQSIWLPHGLPNGESPAHMEAVAKKLWRFCCEADWSVELTSDSGEYPYDWPEICTRYDDPIFEEDLKPDPLGGTGWRWNDPPPKDSPP